MLEAPHFTVLSLEPNNVARQVQTEVVAQAKGQLLAARDSGELIQLATRYPKAVGFFVNYQLDYGESGLVLARQVVDNHPAMKGYLVTRNPELEAYKAELRKHGVYDIVISPLTSYRLKTVVAAMKSLRS